MEQKKLNYSYIERIVYSKQFRSLQDKTQLFYPSQKQRVRTRLTHTLEVQTIAHRIARRLNEYINGYNNKLNIETETKKQKISPADFELIDAIALAHDIGHTPFGHIGERTIDAVLSGKDTLGGIIHKSDDITMRFKHNSNSMRILVELGIKDWRIMEGALSHTRVCYKDDCIIHNNNPFYPFADSVYNHLIEFIISQNTLCFQEETKKNPPSLTLEGQIVAVADEIAQRAADLGDGKIKSRYFNSIEKKLDSYLAGEHCPKAISSPFARLEWAICTSMTKDVAQETFNRLQHHIPVEAKYHGIIHAVYHEKVASFSNKMECINDELDSFVSSFLAQSEDVRESDGRSRYIIRQLYKAYVNDVTLLPDAFIKAHLNRIISRKVLSDVIASSAATAELSGPFQKIKTKKWYVENSITKISSKRLLDMATIKEYFGILKDNHAKISDKNPMIDLLFDAFLLDVGFYIAEMTNTEAFDSYNKIYGHTQS